jgi:hypothetical protein
MGKKTNRKNGKCKQVVLDNVDELVVVDINADCRCCGDAWIGDR